MTSAVAIAPAAALASLITSWPKVKHLAELAEQAGLLWSRDVEEGYREQREAAKRNSPQNKEKKPKPEDGEKKRPKPDDKEKKKPTVTPEKIYFEALMKRAEERNIEMGRFGRYYASGGRGRR